MKGSVERRAAGWTIRVDVGVGPVTGARIRPRRSGFATKKEAERELARWMAELAEGTYVQPRRQTVATFLIEQWLPTKRPTLKPSTVASYEESIRVYVLPRLGGIDLTKLNPGQLNRLYAELLTDGRTGASGRQGGLSPKTVSNIHGILHRALRDAAKWGLIARNPADAADPPRKVEPTMTVWSPTELRTFLAHVEGDRLAAVWNLLATTGMRRGELLGLRWSDVDLEASTVTIVQSRSMAGPTPVVGTPNTVPVLAPSHWTPAPSPRSGPGGERKLRIGWRSGSAGRPMG